MHAREELYEFSCTVVHHTYGTPGEGRRERERGSAVQKFDSE